MGHLLFVLHAAPGSTGVRLLFTSARTSLRAVRCQLPPPHNLKSFSVSSFGADAVWVPATRGEETVRFELDVDGEKLSVQRVLWRGSDGTFADGRADLIDEALAHPGDALEAVRRAADARLAARARSVATEPYARERDFFAELDRQTNADQPVLLPAARADEIRLLLSTLQNRLVDRLLAASPRACRSVTAVSDLSRIQRALFAKHFPAAAGVAGIELPALQRALLLFVNASLRDATRSEHGQPNGAGVFFFAEFGFLAIENGIDVALWTALLPTLVQMQEIYLRVYEPAPPGGRHDWDQWTYQHCNDALRLDDAELVRLAANSPALPLEPLVLENLLKLSPGGIPLGLS